MMQGMLFDSIYKRNLVKIVKILENILRKCYHEVYRMGHSMLVKEKEVERSFHGGSTCIKEEGKESP